MDIVSPGVTEIKESRSASGRVRRMVGDPIGQLRHVALLVGGIAALVGLAVAFYGALWLLTGILWGRIDVLLGWA